MLGKGGMGAVYEGEEITTKKRVAIKAILGIADEDARARFALEAKSMKAIKNNSIPEIYEDRTDAEKDPYYIMEKLQGSDMKKELEEWVRQGYFPLDKERIGEVISNFIKLATKIKTIHDAGIVHRDLKPENVFIVSKDPVITDLGLAFEKGAKERLSQTGMILGTPKYMSPEQAYGSKVKDVADSKEVTDSSDIFSLGVMLYQYLTNTLPFEGASSNAIMINIMTQEPVEPITKNNNITPALNAVVMKMLAKTPRDGTGNRYRNMKALIDELLHVQEEYQGKEIVEKSAESLDRIFPAESAGFSKSLTLDNPMEAMEYMAWRQKWRGDRSR
ncbi:MAG: serine/threonine protein kinase [Candidatus Omnitrophica bacterium]|nr:serine/threonine protein kinase [Candidatus Omnitrophota bacterium]